MNQTSAFNGWLFDHHQYKIAHGELTKRIDAALDGGRNFVFVLTGQSQSGKSELLRDVVSKYGDRQSASDHSLLQYLEASSDSDTASLQADVVKSRIGPVRVEKGKAGQHARNALQASGAKVLLLDELNHLVERYSSRNAQVKGNRQAADWVKEVFSDGISVVLSGLPHIVRLLTDNEQLKGRAHRPIQLKPYSWSADEDRTHFTVMVGAFVTRLREFGWTIKVTPEWLIRRSYLATGGLAGPTRHLFYEAEGQIGSGHRCLTAELLVSAFEDRFGDNPYGNPFEKAELSDELLMKSYMRTVANAESPVYQEDRNRSKKGEKGRR